MKIFNTMTRKEEELTPLVPGEYRIYVCGPTVYNYVHIGNARPVGVFDTLRRYLEYQGNRVLFVSNITDIDDKIIAIPFEDPNWNYYHDIDQLPPHHGNEIAHFFEIYKSLEHKYTATSDALTRSVAVKVIKECIERYEVHYCGKCPSKEYESEKKRIKEEKKEAKEKEKLIKDIRKG